MILGISSFTYGWAVGVEGSMPTQPMKAIDLLQKAIDFNLRCVQFGDNIGIDRLESSLLKEVLDFSIKHQIRLEMGARGLHPENLEKHLEICTFLRSDLLRFVIDGNDFEPSPEQVIAIIKDILPELKKRNITLGIENHDRFKVKTLAKIMESIGSENVGICLDCVNSMGAGEGLEYVADMLSPYTVNLHIKDYSIVRFPHKMGFMVNGSPAGKGVLDLEFLLEKLATHRKCKSAILELWTPPESSLETTLAKEQSWANESVAYLVKNLTTFGFVI
jgi:3-oxoisoapionate decarboxylase